MGKKFDLTRSSDGLAMWSVDFTREQGGPSWKWPKVQVWRAESGSRNFRIGWKMTALGIHLSRQFLSRTEVERLKREAGD